MNKFELMFITYPDANIAEKVIESCTKLIEENNGTIDKVDRWGEKRLAYEIRDMSRGYYVLTTFFADDECVKLINKSMKEDTSVLRYMIMKLGE